MRPEEVKNKIKTLKTTAFGVSIPELRRLAAAVAKDNYREFLDNNTFESFELTLCHAFVIGYAKDDITILLDYFKKFIPYVNRWEFNDSLCQNFKITRRRQEEVWNFLMHYKNSPHEFESRIVSVMLLSHYLNDAYIDRVLKVLDTLNTDDYYAQMGVAWALATIMGKYPEKCLTYLQSDTCHLDKTTYRKTLQKIRESFRVSDEIKQLTKTMVK